MMYSVVCGGLLLSLVATALLADSKLPPEVAAEQNPARRIHIAVGLAEHSIDQAREYYKAGRTSEAAAELDEVQELADDCLNSAEQAHKSSLFKRAEQKISALERRVRSLTEELGYDQREKAGNVADHLGSIHEKLLAGVMGK